MSMTARDKKWATAGFVGGFLLCYLLLAVLGHRQTAVSVPAKAAPAMAWTFPGTATAPNTSLPTRQLVIESPLRWVGTLPERPGPGYSLDLIDDTHHQ
jgi:hypothetical protein